MRSLREGLDTAPGESPWEALARRAEAEWTDATGLSPWWTAPGADVQRLLLSVPGSEIERRMAALARERAVYRLALGMPDQADLVALIVSRGARAEVDAGRICLNLAAFGQPMQRPLSLRDGRHSLGEMNPLEGGAEAPLTGFTPHWVPPCNEG